ncbi:ATPase [Cystobacter fuscus]|uniref:ATPase n=1 Tax=Cystobacter fuscus TaxID=43 RepID=A0A250IVY5_9BACT|nr:ATP-binding protein [Cystobacter fuscus]ATB35438.1 ATPase [Cystobacter fuscus]
MITLVEALRFRSLRYVKQPLNRFHVLVGPNASGKTTFLDVAALLGRLVSDGLDSAIGERTQNFSDLTWRRGGRNFELAIEARIPEEQRQRLVVQSYDTVRYEVQIGLSDTDEVSILAEKVTLKTTNTSQTQGQRELFPEDKGPPTSVLTAKGSKGTRAVVNKVTGGNDSFYPETGTGFAPSFKLGPRKSALGNLPEDESQFPVSTWLKRTLTTGVQQIILNSLLIRKASPPGQMRGFKPDGSNLPWVISELEERAPERFQEWLAHVQTALPELEGLRTVERADDKHRYLMLRYQGGLEVPSWMASDGTLRLLALTLPAYLPDFRGIYLIEEPENGIHPRAVETMFQSLSSVYDAQILLATHSSVILSVVEAKDVLCFAKTSEGATDIVPGNQHPSLKNWQGETNLGVLFAAGVLG